MDRRLQDEVHLDGVHLVPVLALHRRRRRVLDVHVRVVALHLPVQGEELLPHHAHVVGPGEEDAVGPALDHGDDVSFEHALHLGGDAGQRAYGLTRLLDAHAHGEAHGVLHGPAALQNPGHPIAPPVGGVVGDAPPTVDLTYLRGALLVDDRPTAQCLPYAVHREVVLARTQAAREDDEVGVPPQGVAESLGDGLWLVAYGGDSPQLGAHLGDALGYPVAVGVKYPAVEEFVAGDDDLHVDAAGGLHILWHGFGRLYRLSLALYCPAY